MERGERIFSNRKLSGLRLPDESLLFFSEDGEVNHPLFNRVKQKQISRFSIKNERQKLNFSKEGKKEKLPDSGSSFVVDWQIT